MNDPPGSFYVSAGQYQPEAALALSKIRPPAYVAIIGKARTYCSKECKNKTIGKEWRICPQCGGSFITWINAKQIRCSRRCAGVAKSQKIERECASCGITFKIKLRVLAHGVSSGSFCSTACKHRRMSSTTLTISGKTRIPSGGKREDIGLYVRSRWEANYARYLNFLVENKSIRRWEYEPDTFEFKGIKRGTRFYTPDFKVYENNGDIIYHEVKGWMDKRSITRHKRMQKYHPNVVIIMIMGTEIEEIHKKVGGIIAWEYGNKSRV